MERPRGSDQLGVTGSLASSENQDGDEGESATNPSAMLLGCPRPSASQVGSLKPVESQEKGVEKAAEAPETTPEGNIAPAAATQSFVPLVSDEESEDLAAVSQEPLVEYSHKDVPKTLDMQAYSRYVNGGAQCVLPTTLMVRNVPNLYSQIDLIEELNELGFTGAFDFLYMPVDKASKASVGYAFVNFISPGWALRCETLVQGHKFTRHGKNKEASISVAHMQGLAANITYYGQCAAKSAKAALHRPMVRYQNILPLPL